MSRRWAGFVVGIAALSTALVGCGSTSTSGSGAPKASESPSATPVRHTALDAVVAQGQSQVAAIKSTFGNVYSDITFTAQEPNTLVITYTFSKRVDPTKAGPLLATQGPVLDAACRTNFFPQMTKAGVLNPAAQFVYLNPDGSRVGTYHCSSGRTGSTATIAPAGNTPRAAAERFLNALRTHNAAAACAQVVPDEQQQCLSPTFASVVRKASVSAVVIHQTVTSGDRALVSVTGRLCIAGHCRGASDPNTGMPSATTSFEQAWAQAIGQTTTAGSPCERVNGKWYVLLG